MKTQFSIDKWKDLDIPNCRKLLLAFLLGLITIIFYIPHLPDIKSINFAFVKGSIYGKFLIFLFPFFCVFALDRWKLNVLIPIFIFIRTALFLLNFILIEKIAAGKWVITSLFLFPNFFLFPYFLFFSLKTKSMQDNDQKIIFPIVLCCFFAFIDYKYIEPILFAV